MAITLKLALLVDGCGVEEPGRDGGRSAPSSSRP
jgi:hypothetical protein